MKLSTVGNVFEINNSLRAYLCLKKSMVCILFKFQASEQTFFNLLIKWKSRLPPKKISNIEYRFKHNRRCLQELKFLQ